MRRAFACVLLVMVAAAGCSNSNADSAPETTVPAAVADTAPATTPDTTPPTTSAATEASPYDAYLTLVDEFGGDVIERDDAATRAALLCSGAAKDTLGGVPLTEFPTDLALVRSYCPEVEGDY